LDIDQLFAAGYWQLVYQSKFLILDDSPFENGGIQGENNYDQRTY